MKNLLNKKAFEVANIFSKTNDSKTITFKLSIDVSDTYLLNGSKSVSMLAIYDENENLIINSSSLIRYDFNENQTIFLQITTNNQNEEFEIYFYPINKTIVTPYKINIKDTGNDIPLTGNNNKDPLKPATINMEKRNGGTYIYCCYL